MDIVGLLLVGKGGMVAHFEERRQAKKEIH